MRACHPPLAGQKSTAINCSFIFFSFGLIGQGLDLTLVLRSQVLA